MLRYDITLPTDLYILHAMVEVHVTLSKFSASLVFE